MERDKVLMAACLEAHTHNLSVCVAVRLKGATLCNTCTSPPVATTLHCLQQPVAQGLHRRHAHASSDVARKCGGGGGGASSRGKPSPPRPPFLCPSPHNTGHDGARHSSTSSTTTPLKERVCVQYAAVEGTHEGQPLMIASCGAPWQDSEEVQAQCLRGTAIPDALMGVPYTNTSTNRKTNLEEEAVDTCPNDNYSQ
ncbi:hypothetical protein O3P69_019148 [Scylla paramamosain]|uniref:Uncharacterized protein n=1 Tax=Scylla paramamosain TaxID=85552 RepID=A0AAW0SWK0_SCYPA